MVGVRDVVGAEDAHEKRESLPAEIKVTRTQALWSKDGSGGPLIVDVAHDEGCLHWRVSTPKGHRNFADILAGRGLVKLDKVAAGLEVKVGGSQG